jgi:hypothetical protein
MKTKNMYCRDIVASWKPRILSLKKKNKLFNNIVFVERLNKMKDLNTSVNYFSSILNNRVNISVDFADAIESLLRKFEENI